MSWPGPQNLTIHGGPYLILAWCQLALSQSPSPTITFNKEPGYGHLVLDIKDFNDTEQSSLCQGTLSALFYLQVQLWIQWSNNEQWRNFVLGREKKGNIGWWKKENSVPKAIGTGWTVASEAHKIISLFKPQSFWSMIWEINNNNECFQGKPFKNWIKKNCFKRHRVFHVNRDLEDGSSRTRSNISSFLKARHKSKTHSVSVCCLDLRQKGFSQ